MGQPSTAAPSSPGFVPVCAIGASAGGVVALQTLFRLLPCDLGMAYVVVIHLSPEHPSALHEILGASTRMPVFQVEDGPTLKADCVYVIAPDRELVIEGDQVKSQPFDDPRGQRAPIDRFFRSVAAGRGDGIAVVLTGAGADGAVGVRAIKEAGGIVMVQEPAEAGFPSMPQNAIATGVADVVAPLSRLAERIAEAARSKEAVRSLDEAGAANDVRRIVAFLRTRTGHDFSGYKRSTILRRIARRMQVRQILSLDEYARYLRGEPEEAGELLADLLISVTMFFRDPAAFVALNDTVIRPLLERRAIAESEEDLRAWVVGCATGEEAYSLAILLLEESERLKIHVPIQIFATDLDEGALATAREGRYPRSIEADVSAERLKRFFVDEGTHYRIARQIRDMVLFATHSVVREPPFMRLDIITCRNVLIYLERALQSHVCSIFHYGLKPNGYLFLGSAETVDTAQHQFATLERDAHIYSALPTGDGALPPVISTSISGANRAVPHERSAVSRFEPAEVLGASHAAALEANAPPSALVDAEHTVLHLSPTAGRFVLLSAGPLSARLPSIVRPELRLDLKLALDRVFEAVQPTITRLIDVQLEGEHRRVSLHIAPVLTSEGAAQRAIVYFLDNGPGRPLAEQEPSPPLDELRHLHSELKVAQEAELAGRIRHESAVQEMRASNEELQSLNEEYRSTAEELETSKEELQSINEELQTVNAELKSKLSMISAAHNDLQNLTASSEIGTLFLDADLRIRMFTPPVAELINLTQADVGRPITDLTHRLDYDGMEADVRRVLRDPNPSEIEIQGLDGRWFMVRFRPYRTIEGKLEGAVVTFDDVTDRYRAEARLRASEEKYRTLFDSIDEGFALVEVIFDADGKPVDLLHLEANEAYERHTGLHDIVGRRALEIVPEGGPWLDIYGAIARTGRPARSENYLAGPIQRWIASYAAPVGGAGGAKLAIVFNDITERKRAEIEVKESKARLQSLVEGMPQLVWRAVDGGDWTWASPQWTKFTGQAEGESHNWGWFDAVHPDDREVAKSAWSQAMGDGGFQADYRIRRSETDTYRWFQNRASPVRNDAGEIVEWLGTSTDVEDLRALQDTQRVLLHELQHRVRNTLAVVRSIASRTGDTSETVEDFASHMEGRLNALARTQMVLTRAPGEGVDVEIMVREELLAQAAREDQVEVAGPQVRLSPKAAEVLTLAVHELATNAVKYGALSAAAGRVRVGWTVADREGERWLALVWEESGVGVAAVAPRRRGFGSELIEAQVPYELRGRGVLRFRPGGLRCEIEFPLTPRQSILQTDPPESAKD